MIWIWPDAYSQEVLPRLSAAAVPGASEAARAALEAATRWLEKTVEVIPQEVAAAWFGTWEERLPRPDRTLALRPFLADLYQDPVGADAAGRSTEERARVLNMLGFALSAMGRREEALQATQEAVDLYRRLAAQHPDAFLPYLASSLHNLGKCDLSEMGRRAEALQATQEAVDLYRRLAAQHPDAFLPYLAVQPHQPGQPCFPKWAGGRRPWKPRRRRWRSAAAWPPNTPTPSSPTWRGASPTWAFMLSEMGRRAEALQATQEAVDLYRRLAAQHPDAFLPYLAASLNNLGIRLSEIGPAGGGPASHAGGSGPLPPPGRPATPDAFLPYLASQPQQPGRHAFRNGPAGGGPASHAGICGDLPPPGRPAPRRLPPRPGEPASTTWASVLSEMGRRAEALQATQEAVEIRRRLARTTPGRLPPRPGRGAWEPMGRRSAWAWAGLRRGRRRLSPRACGFSCLLFRSPPGRLWRAGRRAAAGLPSRLRGGGGGAR
jgi:tetratricopeptide (TPR) repeat protein